MALTFFIKKSINFKVSNVVPDLLIITNMHSFKFNFSEIFFISIGFVESITVLSMVVIGGIGSVWGIVFASALLSVLPLWFQFIEDYKLLVYGLLLFSVMRFSPGGLSALFTSHLSFFRK